MAKPRINLMIMREGEIDAAVRSYSLPGYMPRLAIVLGVVLVLLATSAVVTIVYFWQAAEDAELLRAENQSMRRSVARISQLEAELEQHRQFTRKVAEMMGIDVPAIPESLAVATAEPEPDEEADLVDSYADDDLDMEGDSIVPPPQTPLEAVSPTTGRLVSECGADPLNRPRGMPVHGRVSRGFMPESTNPGLRHRGIDIATKEGSPIYAPASGIVVYAGQDDVLGLMLTIDHGGGFKTIYGHNSRLHARIGDKVVRGDVIALTGNTGESTAPHLHYEIQRNGHPVDPMDFLGK
jgi:murein DD-endopeptidase MepM/ murein hydrolase activator NlpD